MLTSAITPRSKVRDKGGTCNIAGETQYSSIAEANSTKNECNCRVQNLRTLIGWQGLVGKTDAGFGGVVQEASQDHHARPDVHRRAYCMIVEHKLCCE